MMLKRRKFPVWDIALVIVLVVGAIAVFYLNQANTKAKDEETKLESRLKAAQVNLSQAEKEAVNLEELRRRLEQAKSALQQVPFPTLTEAVAVDDSILQYAEKNKLSIIVWHSNQTSVTLRAKAYSVIRHSLSVTGTADALISFVKDLTQAIPLVPVIGSLEFHEVNPGKGIWQLNLELSVPTR